ncbi:hypothetical protein M8C21_010422 [Ambrosia artemisiifolia]|uniref:Uncharacterized protein n=1 Tax=Ambrosia artemisiifolia TaxID=4212 RepID=A0AAD5CJC1_AMBAR|nr:hypothetical protein M8C21_010422 [Ambrosia artemisiifolia]
MSNGVEANGNQEIHEQELEPMLPKPVENLLECIQGTKDNEKFSSIFEVPSRLRDVNTSSFTPRVVSIGPLHKGGANLKLMEAKKATYLDELLNKVEESSPKETLTKCYEKVMVSIEKIKRCYFGLVMDKAHYTNDELAQMMKTGCGAGLSV